MEGVDIDTTLGPFGLGASFLNHHFPKAFLRYGITREAQSQAYHSYWLHGVQAVDARILGSREG